MLCLQFVRSGVCAYFRMGLKRNVDLDVSRRLKVILLSFLSIVPIYQTLRVACRQLVRGFLTAYLLLIFS